MTSTDSPIILGGVRCSTSKVNLAQIHNAKALVKACTHTSHVQGYRSPGHNALINRYSEADKAFSLALTTPWHKKSGTESKRHDEVSIIN